MADLKESGSGSNLAEDEDADEQKGLAPSRSSASLSRVPTSSLLGGATSPMSPRSSSHITGQYRAVRVVAVPDAIELYQHEAYAEARHRVVQSDFVSAKQTVVEWRMKERMRTISAALVMCLNIGVDPPDVVKPQPCARLECWLDPLAMPPQKALDTIGNALQQQYERWLPPQKARYKLSLDPTLEEIRKLGSAMRKGSKEERVLFHYNGHGVPRPTPNGEIWVFNKTFTQYIPLSIFDLQQWLGTPSIYVFDCSAAGQVLESFIQYEAQFRDPVTKTLENCRESLLLLPCGPNELLPMNPEFPADLFTSCLTAPIKTALRWFVFLNFSFQLIFCFSVNTQ
jgi:regulator-associated protein of mTOR